MLLTRECGTLRIMILDQLMEIARISALAEMASGIAHELNQPLGAIATFSQAGERMLNRSEPLVERALEVFRQINHEALNAGEGIRRIRRLFDQELDSRSRCPMPDLVDEVRPILEMLAERAGGLLEITADPDLPPVRVDRLRIQHVVCALVQNAFEAAEHGAPSARVRVHMSADRYSVETSVTDNGQGVSGAARGQLFRPFFTTKARGTGLGLASSRAIVESHEGTIGFENLVAGGCRFWLRLPAAQNSESANGDSD